MLLFIKRIEKNIKDHRFPLIVWVIWRASHLLVTLYYSIFFGDHGFNTAFYYDGKRYLDIMEKGYTNPAPQMPDTAFFPMVSWIAKPFYILVSLIGNVLNIAPVSENADMIAGHIVATLTSIAAFVAIWKISRLWIGEKGANKTLVVFALFPSSLFLWAFYSEALFIALSAGAIYFDKQNKKIFAAFCFVGLAATRSVGVLVPVVVVFVRLLQARRDKKNLITESRVIIYGLGASIGLGSVLLAMKIQAKDAFAFLKVQDDWGRSITFPWETVMQGFQNLWPKDNTVMVPALVARNWDLWCVGIVLVALVYGFFEKRIDAHRKELFLYACVMIILPFCSASLASFNRFTLATWVVFPLWVSFLSTWPKKIQNIFWIIITPTLIITSIAMVERFSFERFVG